MPFGARPWASRDKLHSLMNDLEMAPCCPKMSGSKGIWNIYFKKKSGDGRKVDVSITTQSYLDLQHTGPQRGFTKWPCEAPARRKGLPSPPRNPKASRYHRAQRWWLSNCWERSCRSSAPPGEGMIRRDDAWRWDDVFQNENGWEWLRMVENGWEWLRMVDGWTERVMVDDGSLGDAVKWLEIL